MEFLIFKAEEEAELRCGKCGAKRLQRQLSAPAIKVKAGAEAVPCGERSPCCGDRESCDPSSCPAAKFR